MSEFGLPNKVVSDVLKLLQATWQTSCSIIVLQPSKQGEGLGMQKFVKRTIKGVVRLMITYICFVTVQINTDQPWATKPGHNPVKYTKRDILPRFSRLHVLYDNDNINLTVLKNRQPLLNESIETCKLFLIYLEDQL